VGEDGLHGEGILHGLVVLSMLFLFRMSAKEIVGSNIVIALIMVIPAGLTHYLEGGVEWLLAFLLLGSWLATAPGGAILLAVLAFTFLGDRLQRALDPKLNQYLRCSVT
jgi:uncharacterized membrane protein YfcA